VAPQPREHAHQHRRKWWTHAQAQRGGAPNPRNARASSGCAHLSLSPARSLVGWALEYMKLRARMMPASTGAAGTHAHTSTHTSIKRRCWGGGCVHVRASTQSVTGSTCTRKVCDRRRTDGRPQKAEGGSQSAVTLRRSPPLGLLPEHKAHDGLVVVGRQGIGDPCTGAARGKQGLLQTSTRTPPPPLPTLIAPVPQPASCSHAVHSLFMQALTSVSTWVRAGARACSCTRALRSGGTLPEKNQPWVRDSPQCAMAQEGSAASARWKHRTASS
jgi:hypothetical protein